MGLRNALDRDVYQIVKKLEDVSNDGKPFKSIYQAYDAIKRSNSSLSRQKKRPLEDALDRVLQLRKQELGDSEDSEAELEKAAEAVKPSGDDRLLNRQLIKHWNVKPLSTNSPTNAGAGDSPRDAEKHAAKKRKLQSDNEEERPALRSGSEAPPAANGLRQDARADKDGKTVQKKSQRPTRYDVQGVEDLRRIPRLGGVDDVLENLCATMLPTVDQPEWIVRARRCPGAIISGPPGTGKKTLVKTLAYDLQVPLISLAGCFEDVERVEKSLTEAVDAAISMAPSILFVEHLDQCMPRPDPTSHNDYRGRATRHFIAQMQRINDKTASHGPVFIMATTSRIADVDPAVLQTEAFAHKVKMRVPNQQARQAIFTAVMRELEIEEELDVQELARLTHGYVGSDVVNVAKLATSIHHKRIMAVLDPEKECIRSILGYNRPTDQLELKARRQQLASMPANPVDISLDDFKQAIHGFTPSLRGEGFTAIPSVSWDQVGALSKIRQQLHRSIIGPIMHPDMYRSFGLEQPAGVLLWGPPGCGKTLVAQAVANQAQASFILINGPELLNKYVGESERSVRELFERARSSKPCILFFDEMDSIVPKRDKAATESGARVVNALLTELDGAQDRTGIYVIGTTNRPDMIDEAMLRPGRLSVRLFIDLPTPEERVDILNAIFRRRHETPSEADMARLPVVALDPRCNDFSGADLNGLHTKAAEFALGRWEAGEKTLLEIDEVDWEHALATTRGSVGNPESYRRLEAKHGQAVMKV